MFKYFAFYSLPLLISLLFIEIFQKEKLKEPMQTSNDKYMEILSNLQKFDSTLFLRRIQKLAMKHHLNIRSIKQNQNEINIEFLAQFSQWIQFLKEIEKVEKYVQIKSLEVDKNNFKIGFITGEKINQNFVSVDVLSLSNPFYINSINDKINLEAIIGNFAIIDSKIFRVGDKYEEFILHSIQKDYIVLRNSSMQVMVRLKNA